MVWRWQKRSDTSQKTEGVSRAGSQRQDLGEAGLVGDVQGLVHELFLRLGTTKGLAVAAESGSPDASLQVRLARPP